jgi:hypothetical protein
MLSGLLGDLSKNPIIKPLVTRIAEQAQFRQRELNAVGTVEALKQLQADADATGSEAILLSAVIDGRAVMAVAVISGAPTHAQA